MDTTLFEQLRSLRKQLAGSKNVPPFVIFGDATLREFARVRPSSLLKMRLVHGVGDAKLRDYGENFLQIILAHCSAGDVAFDQASAPVQRTPTRAASGRPNPMRDLALTLFRQQATLSDVVWQTKRSEGVIVKYLCEFIQDEKPPQIEVWVPAALYERVATVARKVGMDRLKPVFIELEEKVSYDQIRIVLTHMEAMGA